MANCSNSSSHVNSLVICFEKLYFNKFDTKKIYCIEPVLVHMGNGEFDLTTCELWQDFTVSVRETNHLTTKLDYIKKKKNKFYYILIIAYFHN